MLPIIAMPKLHISIAFNSGRRSVQTAACVTASFLRVLRSGAIRSGSSRHVAYLAIACFLLAITLLAYGTLTYAKANAHVATNEGGSELRPEGNAVLLRQNVPVVSLAGLSPSPIQEGQSLQISLTSNRPITAADTEDGSRLLGGVLIFDPSDAPFATSLNAFTF